MAKSSPARTLPVVAVGLAATCLLLAAYAFAQSNGPGLEICWAIFEDGFMPHGHCYLWQPGLVWTHVGSDALIALSYFTIPFSLLYFVKRRPDIRFRGMFILFGSFICLCGLTHMMAVINVWNGAYWLSGIVKVATGLVSAATAYALAKSLPVALSIPLPEEYKRMSARLETESAEREKAVKRLRARVESDTEKFWESDSRWRLLSEFAYSAVWVTEPDGSVTQELPSWSQLTGQMQEQYAGFGWLDAYKGEDRDQLEAEWRRCVKEKTSFELETQVWSQENKQYIPVMTKGIAIKNSDEEVIEWIGVVHDLSKIKRQEQKLRSYSRHLQVKNEYLQEFAHAASHDLREPLRKIRSYGDILKEDHSDEVSEEAQRFIGVMQDASQRMSVMIEDLLEYSEASSFTVELETIELDDLIDEVESDLEVAIRESGARIRREGIGAVLGDRTQLLRIFQNLLSNSIKYRRAGVAPEITISQSTIHLETDPDEASPPQSEAFCKITIADNGIGFDPKYADKILKPFQRLHTRSEYPGTGIGLAICQRIIERHNGRLEVESAPGAGAAFSIYLPSDA